MSSPPIQYAIVASRISVQRQILFQPSLYQRAHCLGVLIISNMDTGEHIFAILAIGRRAWYLFLSTLPYPMSAEFCYHALFEPDATNLQNFIGCGIPFSGEDSYTLNLDRCHVTIQRGSFGLSNVSFRLIFGTERTREQIVTPVLVK